eukprot:3469293-Pyramimonas_sp.AAC.1
MPYHLGPLGCGCHGLTHRGLAVQGQLGAQARAPRSGRQVGHGLATGGEQLLVVDAVDLDPI